MDGHAGPVRIDGDEFLKAARDASIAARAQAGLNGAQARVHLPEFLPQRVARQMSDDCAKLNWKLLLNEGQQSFHVPFDHLAKMTPEQRNAMLSNVYGNARDRFQFLYECSHVAEDYESGVARAGPIAEWYALMNSEQGIAALRALTGDDRINYADAIATRYRPGHFLTQHNDEVAAEGRLYAYVLNLSPQWRADWGGLLMFIADDGHIAEAFTPRLGALNIFRVPQAHSVSVVSPFAGAPRYSISGWFRSSRPAARA